MRGAVRCGAVRVAPLHPCTVIAYIRVSVILVPAPATLTVPLLLLSVIVVPQLLGEVPLSAELVRAPPASRVKVSCGMPPDIRHVMPNVGSRICIAEPDILEITCPIAPSVPVKPAYLRCQGRVAVRIVAWPLMHVPSMALLIYPIRVLTTLAIVLEWREPSSVSGHSMVPAPLDQVYLLHAALSAWLVVEKFLAEATPTRAPSRTVAIAMVNMILRGPTRSPPIVTSGSGTVAAMNGKSRRPRTVSSRDRDL